jgi:hypothetical protein
LFEVGKTYLNTQANSLYLCKAIVGEHAWVCNIKSGFDFIAPWHDAWEEYTPPPKMVKKEGWINVYGSSYDSQLRYGGDVYPCSDKAIVFGRKMKTYKTTIHIEWEEEEEK